MKLLTEKRIAELSAIFKRLCEDSVAGRISGGHFTELSADYEAEQNELKERAAVLQGRAFKGAGSHDKNRIKEGRPQMDDTILRQPSPRLIERLAFSGL